MEIEECGALFFVTVEEARGAERSPQQGPHSPPRVHQPGRARHLSPSRSGCAQPMKTMLSAFSPISETSKTREVTHMALPAGEAGAEAHMGTLMERTMCEAMKRCTLRDQLAKLSLFFPTRGYHGLVRCKATHDSASEVRVSFRVRGRQKIIKLFVSGRRSWRH